MRVTLLFLFFIVTSHVFGKSIIVSSKGSAHKVIAKLKNLGVEYKISRIKKNNIYYELYVQDLRLYRTKKIQRNKRRIIKRKTYLQQSSSKDLTRINIIKKRLVKFGLNQRHILILKKKQQKISYKITYNKIAKVPVEEEANTALAQSSIVLSQEVSDKSKEYVGSFINVVTGMEYEKSRFFGVLKLRAEKYDQNYLYLNSEEKEKSSSNHFELDETYLKFTQERYSLTLGKQLFSWGVFDELSFFDRVNIKNNERFIFDFGEQYRRPLTSLRYQYLFDSSKLDVYVDFGVDKSRLPKLTSNWSGVDVYNGRIRGIPLSDIEQNIIKNMNLNLIERNSPGIGMRYSFSNSVGDFSFNFIRAHSNTFSIKFSRELQAALLTNVFSMSALKKGVDVYFPVETVVGLDYTNAFGAFILKMELGTILDSPYLDKNFNLEKQNKIVGGIGGEYEMDSIPFRLDFQYVIEKLNQDDVWGRTKYDRFFYRVSKKFLREMLEIGIKQIITLVDDSYYSGLYIKYEWTDNFSSELGGNTFNGKDGTFFGYHNEDSFSYLKLKYLF